MSRRIGQDPDSRMQRKGGVEISKERRDGGRAIGGRGKMERSGVGGKGGKMIWGRGTRHEGAGSRREREEGGGRELRGEGGGAKQERREHEKKGERWEEGTERWRWDEGETCMRGEGEGEGCYAITNLLSPSRCPIRSWKYCTIPYPVHHDELRLSGG